jgi:hypothetical protein
MIPTFAVAQIYMAFKFVAFKKTIAIEEEKVRVEKFMGIDFGY